MKLVIGKGTRKREIEAPFGICASRGDFERLHKLIGRFLADPGNGCGIAYGWLDVSVPAWNYGPTNTEPEPWE